MSPAENTVRSTFQGTRVLVTSARGFEEILASLKEQMGTGTVAQIAKLAQEAPDAAGFERLVEKKFLGTSGFMLFAEIDHGSWVSIYGVNRRTIRFVLGNPLIAITMMRENITTGLFVPVELLLTETADGQGCTIDYVLQSSLIASNDENTRLSAAALVLDRKLATLIATTTGMDAK